MMNRNAMQKATAGGILVLAMFTCIGIAADGPTGQPAAKPANKEPQCWFTVSHAPMTRLTSYGVSNSYDFGGEVICKVNDNPAVPNLNRDCVWFRDGENTVSFVGKHAKPIYLCIYRMRPMDSFRDIANLSKRFDKVLFTATIPPTAEATAEQAVVAKLELPGRAPVPEFEEIKDRDKAEKEVRAVVKQLDDAQRAHDVGFMMEFRKKDWELIEREAAELGLPKHSMRAFMDDEYKTSTTYDPIPLDKLEIVFGKSAVAVCTGRERGRPYITQFVDPSRHAPAKAGQPVPTDKAPGIILVHVDGKWIKWGSY